MNIGAAVLVMKAFNQTEVKAGFCVWHDGFVHCFLYGKAGGKEGCLILPCSSFFLLSGSKCSAEEGAVRTFTFQDFFNSGNAAQISSDTDNQLHRPFQTKTV